MENLLSCPICWELFRDAQELPCQHSLCLECAQGSANQGHVLCPMCRQRTPLTSLRSNFVLNNIVEVYKTNRRSHTNRSYTSIADVNTERLEQASSEARHGHFNEPTDETTPLLAQPLVTPEGQLQTRTILL